MCDTATQLRSGSGEWKILAIMTSMQPSQPDQTPLKHSRKPEELQSQIFPDGSVLIESAAGIYKLEPPPRRWGDACPPTSLP